MKDRLEKLITRIDAFNQRERIMLLAAVIVCIYVIWDSVLLRPLEEDKKSAMSEIQSLNNQVSGLEIQINSIMQQNKVDPDKANKSALEKLKQDISVIDDKLKNATLGLITPRQMPKVLEDVLHKSKNIKLVRMESIPAVSLIEPKESNTVQSASESAGIFRHGLLMEIEGGYLDTLAFLQSLEKLEWKLYWDAIEFKTEKYPTAKVIIKVYTLSLDKGWIGV
ncbi:MAG: type II secretion system protein M [Gammaproteobacteria bacterium]|nr:type II secretion system protein M [Gammaproteobacteria bacterium]MDH5594037.1 type II secretion system protein M [Gammaproteobacteria bacterium]